MKYEAVFGDQSLFDGASKEAVLVISDMTPRAPTIEFFADEKLNFETADVDSRRIKVAMRRIIADPKRWTVADQKAGRLPEVGCEYIGRDVLLTCVLVDKNRDVWGKSKDNLMHCYNYLEIKPIETPDEKARREEDEFVKSEMKNTTLSMEWSCVYERGLRAAYRKLKGGA